MGRPGRGRQKGTTLVELLIALTIMAVVVVFIGNLMTQSSADMRANAAAQDAADQAYNLLLTFRKNFLTKAPGNDRACVTGGLPPPPSSAYCRARCTGVTKNDCLELTTRRGLGGDYLDTTFETLCETRPTTIANLVPSTTYRFPSRCRTPVNICSANQRPYVQVTATRTIGGVAGTPRVTRFPPTGNGGGNASTTIGAEFCVSVNDSVAVPEGSIDVNIRTFFLSSGRAGRQPVFKDDISQSLEEAAIQNADLVVMP